MFLQEQIKDIIIIRVSHVPADFTLANGASVHIRAPSDAAPVMGDFALANGAAAQAHDSPAATPNGDQPPRARPPRCSRQQVGAQAINRGTSNADARVGVAVTEVIGPPVSLVADIQLRRYTQITQRHQPRGRWTGTLKAEQLDRLKSFYADPLTPRGDLDPHRFLGQRVARTFAKDNHPAVYEGTVVSFDFLSLNYGSV